MAEDNEPILLTFGGGIDARKSPLDVNPSDCVDGDNFDLDTQFNVLRRRLSLGTVATAPNGERINGLAQLIKQDATTSTLVQAGGTIYEWDGTETGFTPVGTVSPAARLRGPIDSNYTLDEFVIITDITKTETVKQWDGTTFKDFTHNLGVNFFAKYVIIENERAIFWNVKTGTTDTPHIILASKVSDSSILTVTDRPSTAMGADDPFFIPTPDLLPLNGVVKAFGEIIFSTQRGRLWVLKHNASFTASDSTGVLWSIEDLYAGISAAGDEAMVNSGNDVIIGVQGRIESLSGILAFGDVETNDLSMPIQPLIKNTASWILLYDPLKQRVFCWPNDDDVAHVLHKSLLRGGRELDPERSPWSRWSTSLVGGFQPTAVGAFFDPASDVPLDSTLSSGSSQWSFPGIFFGIQGGGIQRESGIAGDTTSNACATGKSSVNPTMTSNTTPSGIVNASSANAAQFAAFNNRDVEDTPVSFWVSKTSVQGFDLPHWIEYDFDTTEKVVKQYKLIVGFDSGLPLARTPYSWTFEGTNFSSGGLGINYTGLHSQTGFVAWENEAPAGVGERTFTISNNTLYQFYRLRVTATYGSAIIGYTGLDEGLDNQTRIFTLTLIGC
ncbi:hypothetical protein LCGC14_1403340 [marine sediment metagenome]|uniref:F5/8 type C domain-containing protein n=1 Tax=marine sediment metagenome TaxID=412755 RepID=A0A0F9JWE5_9ZZZZ